MEKVEVKAEKFANKFEKPGSIEWECLKKGFLAGHRSKIEKDIVPYCIFCGFPDDGRCGCN